MFNLSGGTEDRGTSIVDCGFEKNRSTGVQNRSRSKFSKNIFAQFQFKWKLKQCAAMPAHLINAPNKKNIFKHQN